MRPLWPLMAFIVVGCTSRVSEHPLFIRPTCVSPTIEEARVGRPITVDVAITSLEDNGTLRADQIGCPRRLNIVMRGNRRDLERLRSLVKESIRRSSGTRQFLVTVQLSGALAVSPPFPEREGPADVMLDVESASGAKIVEYK